MLRHTPCPPARIEVSKRQALQIGSQFFSGRRSGDRRNIHYWRSTAPTPTARCGHKQEQQGNQRLFHSLHPNLAIIPMISQVICHLVLANWRRRSNFRDSKCKGVLLAIRSKVWVKPQRTRSKKDETPARILHSERCCAD